MRFFRIVAGVFGVLCLSFAALLFSSASESGSIIASVNPRWSMQVEVQAIAPDSARGDRMLVTVALSRLGTPRTVALMRQDALRLAPGQAIAIHPTGIEAVAYVSDGYYRRHEAIWRIAGYPLDPGGVLAGGLSAILAMGLFYFTFRSRKERSRPWPAPAAIKAPKVRRPSQPAGPPVAAPLSANAALGDRQYHVRVAALALLGQTMVLGTLVTYLGTLAGLIVLLIRVPASAILLKFLVLPVGAAGWSMLQALWIRLQPPAGIDVTRAEAPALFALLDRLRKAANAPAIHRVAIDGSFNAGISQVPRLGLFGWHRNHVVLGLPLLQSLTEGQVETVLAHELAHLQRGHARFGNWIYRVRMTWLRIDHYLQTHRNWTLMPFRALFGWYMPRFHAYSFAHARAQEYEADRFAARLTSAPATAGALVAVAVEARRFDETFWPAVFREARHQPQPPAGPYQSLSAFFAEPAPPDRAQAYIDDRLAMAPSEHDTHPTLRDRLAALDQPAALPERSGPAAAGTLLGAHLPAVAAALDSGWRTDVSGWWSERYEEASAAEARLGELLAAETERPLAVEELATLALLTEDWRDSAAAVPRFRAWLAAEPESTGARYGLGRVLPETDTPAAIDLLEQAMREDVVIAPQACRLIAGRLAATGGEPDPIRDYLDRAAEAQHEIDQAEQERDFFYSDTLIPHGLDAPALAAIAEGMRGLPAVGRIWLSRKQLHHLPDRSPLFIGLVEIPWITRKRREVLQQVADALPVPGKVIVFLRERASPSAVRKLPSFDGALVYRKDQGSSSVSQ